MRITLDEKDYICDECGAEMVTDYARYGDSYDEELCLICTECDNSVRARDL